MVVNKTVAKYNFPKMTAHHQVSVIFH